MSQIKKVRVREDEDNKDKFYTVSVPVTRVESKEQVGEIRVTTEEYGGGTLTVPVTTEIRGGGALKLRVKTADGNSSAERPVASHKR